MIKGNKSIRNGVQDVLCPFTNLYISQGSGFFDGGYSHKGSRAIDVINGDGEKAPYYAPCDIKCVGLIISNGQAFWQSTKKVRLANGKVDYISFITCHDESINYGVDLVIKQGDQMGNMGTMGNATGVHCHIQFALGKYGINDFKQNEYGVGVFPNELEIEDVCFMDNTNILNGVANWIYLKDVPINEDIPKFDEKCEDVNKYKNEIKELNEKIDTLTKESYKEIIRIGNISIGYKKLEMIK